MDDTRESTEKKVTCRYREDGLDLLVKQLLLKDGFVGLVLPRISLDGDEISVTVSMNIGVGSREREYFAFEFDIPVNDLAKKYEALNAIELKKELDEIDKHFDAAEKKPFSPFGRDSGTNQISEKDAEKLRGEPAPIKVLVPVEIEKDEKSPDAGASVTGPIVPS